VGPDGLSITNIRVEQGVSNVWRQPLNGGASEKITNFDSGVIVTHAWTADGSLILGRGTLSSDAVIITNFR